MQLLIKANVKNPGSRGGKVHFVDGQVRYGDAPKPKKHKYLAKVTMSDGTVKYIYPDESEVDEHGQVIGGQAKIREIINREFFGEHGFNSNGEFWQKPGLMFKYQQRTAKNSKVVVDEIARHEGFTAFEFADSSVSRAYGDGLPKKFSKYQIEAKPHDPVPERFPIDHDAEREPSDVPPPDERGIINAPRHLPETAVALGEPLTAEEDPIELASAFLERFLRGKKQRGPVDEVVGTRKVRDIEDVPAWILNKFDSPEELQHLLGRANALKWNVTSKVKNHMNTEVKRAEGGKPMTTLITFGLWNSDPSAKRHRNYLEQEWRGFVRKWAKHYAGVFQGATSFQSHGDSYIRDRERDLYQIGMLELQRCADNYVPNAEVGTIAARFDKTARNEIKKHMKQWTQQHALENGAEMDDMREEDAYHTPKTISPREHFELRHYEPLAISILDDAMVGLKPHQKAAFWSRFWLDDGSHPDTSEEKRYNEARERQQAKMGESKRSWERPYTRTAEHSVTSVADKLADTIVTMQGGKQARLGDLYPQKQRYYLQQWYEDALNHVREHLKTPKGGLSPNGMVVEKWLRLEAKVAQLNRRDIEARVDVPTVKMELQPRTSSETRSPFEHPAVQFFRTNRELAMKLGVANNLDMPQSLKNVKVPTAERGKLHALTSYHQLHTNLEKLPDLKPVHEKAAREAAALKNHGHWTTDVKGGAVWSEDNGVEALHNAAKRMIADNSEANREAFSSLANSMGGSNNPMAVAYIDMLRTSQVPTDADLATWKTRAHAAHRDAQNKLHVIEFVQESRKMKKATVNDLMKAFRACNRAYEQLSEVI